MTNTCTEQTLTGQIGEYVPLGVLYAVCLSHSEQKKTIVPRFSARMMCQEGGKSDSTVHRIVQCTWSNAITITGNQAQFNWHSGAKAEL